MHELSIVQAVVELCAEHAAGRSVTQVTLEIGRLSGVLPDAVRFCFPMCCEGTALEGATLLIDEPAGVGQCRACGSAVELRHPLDGCACGAFDVEVKSGEQLRVMSIEISNDA